MWRERSARHTSTRLELRSNEDRPRMTRWYVKSGLRDQFRSLLAGSVKWLDDIWLDTGGLCKRTLVIHSAPLSSALLPASPLHSSYNLSHATPLAPLSATTATHLTRHIFKSLNVSSPTCAPSSRMSTRSRSARPKPSAFARSTTTAFPYACLQPPQATARN